MVRDSVLVAIASALIATTGASSPAAAQSGPSSIDVVDAGRPLRVELDRRIRLQSAGQVVTGSSRAASTPATAS